MQALSTEINRVAVTTSSLSEDTTSPAGPRISILKPVSSLLLLYILFIIIITIIITLHERVNDWEQTEHNLTRTHTHAHTSHLGHFSTLKRT